MQIPQGNPLPLVGAARPAMPHSAGGSFLVSHFKMSRDANTAVIYSSLLRCQFRKGLPRCQIPWSIPFTMPIPWIFFIAMPIPRVYCYRDANSASLFFYRDANSAKERARCQIPW